MSKNEWNGLIEEMEELDLQLELQHRIQQRQKDEKLQQEKVEKRQQRKLKKEKDNNVTPETQDQMLTKLAKKQQEENWNNAKQNYNVIKYMHYTELAIDQSNKIHLPTFWCYYDPHGNTTRMRNDPRAIKEEISITPVTISPAKASLKKITKKI